MITPKHGGPAFPVTMAPNVQGRAAGEQTVTLPGMMLRDYFAAKALIGVLSTCEREPGGATASLNAADIARASYEFADAMLAERAK